ncbi:MAG TPA: hypothetical protein VFJ16_15500 [Longimicrobium sp.]|nr:hypothetical protein [Longimicrobium sp.]
MKRSAHAALALAAVMVLPACATTEWGTAMDVPRHVELRLEPAAWTLANSQGDARLSMREYVPAGESLERWTRFVSVQTFSDARVPFPGARWAMSECRALLQTRCPGATWTLLSEAPDDGTYEWRISGCPGQPDQHEVGRILRLGGTWARVTFTVQGRMDPATREEWLRRLGETRLVAGAW